MLHYDIFSCTCTHGMLRCCDFSFARSNIPHFFFLCHLCVAIRANLTCKTKIAGAQQTDHCWNMLEPLAKNVPQSDEEAHSTVPKPCSQTCVPHDMDMHSWKLGCLSNYVAQKYCNTDRRHPPILTSTYKNALPFDSF